ncbi:ABC transporter substrate-binding protein [Alicyclobacillus sp. SO9]|uniref:ABC transporter substrate-binding protein n=1 Tax=Alicyclobacillus sp. SO9 TaxID=2665646 RepID=UPI0018E84B71|nr:extracellular solute-binding protein [Alicyclobacillus sp. SO9]QQE78720.1 extracellular solute-binding protein [Alicyclobacillus sp. SO9]
MKRVIITVSGFLALATAVTGCGSSTSNSSGNSSTGSSGGKVTLQFLQNKTEAAGEFDKLIKQFEQKNPNIKITQINPPNADTVLKTDLTKNQLPDIISMGADSTFIEMAQTGVLKSFAGSSELNNINPTYVKMLEKEVGKSDPYGLPFTVNAEPLLYNKTLLKKYKLTPPTTWSEMMSDAQKIKAAGGTPFYFGFKDSWTTMVPWNALAANLQGPNFFKDLKSGKATFSNSYQTVAKRMQQLASYGEPGEFGKGYNDANKAFANGKSVFYIQGDWAISSIMQANPKLKLGAVLFPATNNASQTKLVSGIDSVLTMTTKTKHAADAQKFIDFLIQKSVAQSYSDSQKLFSAVTGVKDSSSIVAPLQQYMKAGRISDYPDHYYPSAMDANVSNMIQGFLVKKTAPATFLKSLDSAYQKAIKQQ